MKTNGFMDGIRALADGFADIFSLGEFSVSKAHQAAKAALAPEQARKADNEALAGGWMAVYKDMTAATGSLIQSAACPLCQGSIEVACGVGYCRNCGAWITPSKNT